MPSMCCGEGEEGASVGIRDFGREGVGQSEQVGKVLGKREGKESGRAHSEERGERDRDQRRFFRMRMCACV